MKNKLDKKEKIIWLKELRSGKYKQGKDELYTKENDSYCCLGVARACGLGRKSNLGNELLSMTFLDQEIQFDLGQKNDNGMPFEEIANWIEKNL